HRPYPHLWPHDPVWPTHPGEGAGEADGKGSAAVSVRWQSPADDQPSTERRGPVARRSCLPRKSHRAEAQRPGGLVMLSWLLVNVGLSLLALGFIFLNGGAPHRLRFFAGFAALAAWLVPWTLLPELPLAIDFSRGWVRRMRGHRHRLHRTVGSGASQSRSLMILLHVHGNPCRLPQYEACRWPA